MQSDLLSVLGWWLGGIVKTDHRRLFSIICRCSSFVRVWNLFLSPHASVRGFSRTSERAAQSSQGPQEDACHLEICS